MSYLAKRRRAREKAGVKAAGRSPARGRPGDGEAREGIPGAALALMAALLLMLPALPAHAQQAASQRGAVERIVVHGKGLEGNLEGDSPDRHVSIYLPASYKAHPERRYPVIYFLHGFTDDDAEWYGFKKHWINLPAVIDKAAAAGETREMIVVTPDAYTRFAGSMYSNSITTGDWEDYVARELVASVDAHFRTIPHAASRGLAGHSMGGYGTMRIGMKHPEIFSSIYLLSPCCMMPGFGGAPNPQMQAAVAAVHNMDDFAKASFFTKAMFASAAAWSPDPKNPPFFIDLPTGGEKSQAMVRDRWTANAPMAMIDQYVTNLRKLHAIGFDAGEQDPQIEASIKVLDQVLTNYGIPHGFETYQGTHISRIAERIETKMLPFFSKNLSFVGARGAGAGGR